MTSSVSSKNKEKKAKRKNSVKKERRNRQKKRYKETENSVAGSRLRFICTFKQLHTYIHTYILYWLVPTGLFRVNFTLQNYKPST